MTDETLVQRLLKGIADIDQQQEAADRIEALEREAILDAKLLADTQALLDTAVEFIQEVRRNGDTRLASMAIAVLAEIEKGKTNG